MTDHDTCQQRIADLEDALDTVIGKRLTLETRLDQTEAHHALLANAVHQWLDARTAYLFAESVAPEDLQTAEPRLVEAEHALTGVARMLDDIGTTADIVFIHRAAIHRRDRKLASYMLTEAKGNPHEHP